MQMRFGMLADYAGAGAMNKLIIVGIWETVHDVLGVKPIPLPLCYLVAAFDAHSTEGTDHRVEVRLTNQDGVELQQVAQDIKFLPTHPGRPLRGHFLGQLLGFTVPDHGDYAFHFLIDGRHVGEVPLAVIPAPAGQ